MSGFAYDLSKYGMAKSQEFESWTVTTSGIENYLQELSLGLENQGTGRFTLNKITRSPVLMQLSQQ